MMKPEEREQRAKALWKMAKSGREEKEELKQQIAELPEEEVEELAAFFYFYRITDVLNGLVKENNADGPKE